jgi:hypothetical protein
VLRKIEALAARQPLALLLESTGKHAGQIINALNVVRRTRTSRAALGPDGQALETEEMPARPRPAVDQDRQIAPLAHVNGASRLPWHRASDQICLGIPVQRQQELQFDTKGEEGGGGEQKQENIKKHLRVV